MVDETTVINTAVDAAESVIFSRFDRGQIEDLDVHVAFVDEELTVDVYLNVDDSAARQVADDAALAAMVAVDDLME